MTKEYKGFLIVVYWSNKYMGFPFKIVKEKKTLLESEAYFYLENA